MGQRKTKDEYQLEGFYDGEWGYLLSEDTYVDAQRQKRCYMENDPRAYRIRKRRVPVADKND